jgi:hypothetical protein
LRGGNASNPSLALADADVNARQATALAGHASLSAHARYLANAGKMRRLPETALPNICIVDAETLASVDPVVAANYAESFGGADGTRTRGLRRDRPAL